MKAGCIGELVIDFISSSPAQSIEEAASFRKCPGGSPANVAASLQAKGMETTLISRVGSDRFGAFLHKTVADAGLSTHGISIDPKHPTRCVFMAHDMLGRRSIEIANRQSADQHIAMDQVSSKNLGRLDLLHIGGTTLLGEVTAATTLALLERVKKGSGVVSFDPNINLNRISDAALSRLRHLMPFVDILKVNEEEWRVLAGLFSQYPRIVVTTLGEKGALIKTPIHTINIQAHKVEVVDVTGAGDAFFAGFLGCLLNHAADPLNASRDVLRLSGEKGNVDAAQVIQCMGGALSNQSYS